MEIMQNAFNTSLTSYIDTLYRYGMVLSRNPATAADLVQETCLRALRARERLLPDSNLKGWLLTILRNIWLNELRRNRNCPETADFNGAGSPAYVAMETSADPLAFYLGKVEQERVREAILRLPVEFREIILLREYEEFSYQEIARVLELPAGTVMSRLARARVKLRALLCSPPQLSQAKEKKESYAPYSMQSTIVEF